MHIQSDKHINISNLSASGAFTGANSRTTAYTHVATDVAAIYQKTKYHLSARAQKMRETE